MGGVLLRGELGAKAELFQDDGHAEAAGELAGDGRGHALADVVVRHEVDMRAGKIDEGASAPERIAVVVPGTSMPQAPSPREIG